MKQNLVCAAMCVAAVVSWAADVTYKVDSPNRTNVTENLTIDGRLIKTGWGLLKLTGHNAFGGNVSLQEGIIQADFGQGLDSNYGVDMFGGWLSSVSGSITAEIGNGPGQINVKNGSTLYATRFTAVDEPLTVNIGGDLRAIPLDGTTYNKTLCLNGGSTYANADLHFLNPLVMSYNDNVISVASRTAWLEGSVTKSGDGWLKKNDPGTLVLKGENNAIGCLWANGGTTILDNTTRHSLSFIRVYEGASLLATNQTVVISSNTNIKKGSLVFKDCIVTNGDSFNIGINDSIRADTKLLTIDGGRTKAGAIYAGQTAGKTGEINILGHADVYTDNAVTINGGSATMTDSTLNFSKILAHGGVTTIKDCSVTLRHADSCVGDVQGMKGVLVMDGGTIENSFRYYVGQNGGFGSYFHKGGTNTAGYVWYIGHDAGSTGEVVVTGGKVAQTINGGDMRVGTSGNGFLDVHGTGLVDVSRASVQIAVNAGAVGRVELGVGGTLYTKYVGGGSGSSKEFYFDGGTLKAVQDDTSSGFVRNLTGFGMSERGGIVDSNGHSVKFANAISSKPIRELRANGLVHRWGFNGDLVDSVGGSEAFATGTTYSENGEIMMSGNATDRRQSYVDLGQDLLPADGSSFTIEIWATLDELYYWEPMFFAGCTTNLVGVFWAGGDPKGRARASHNNANDEKFLPAYDTKTEYHVALVCEQVDGRWNVVVYNQDSASGRTLTKEAIAVANGWAPDAGEQTNFYLGGIHSNPARSNNARFNEVRIWRRALAEDELTANAVAGPDALVFSGPFEKKGVGTLTLTGANTYTNDTVVSQGTLALASGATLRAGNRVVVVPGATVSFAGQNLATGTLAFNATADGFGTLVNTSGTLDLSGLALEVNVLGELPGREYAIVTSAGGFTGSFASTTLPKSWKVVVSGNSVKLVKQGLMIIVL